MYDCSCARKRAACFRYLIAGGGIDRCGLEGLGDLSKVAVSYMSMERVEMVVIGMVVCSC